MNAHGKSSHVSLLEQRYYIIKSEIHYARGSLKEKDDVA